MAIAFDAASADFTTGAGQSWSHTCTGADLVLLVGVNTFTAGLDDDVTGVTYDGDAMTLIVNQEGPVVPPRQYSSLWYLINPSTGANTVAVTKTSSDAMRSIACSYTGCDQSAQPDAFTSKKQNVQNIMLAVTSTVDNCWAVTFAMNDASQLSAGANTTARDTSLTFVGFGDSNGVISPAGEIELNWTKGGAANNWTMLDATIQPPQAAAGTNAQINIGDAWKLIAGMQINIGDTWKTVEGMQINIGDAWKEIF